jgi:hypothetical protein
MAMAEIVLRVRLIADEHLDVTYDEDGGRLRAVPSSDGPTGLDLQERAESVSGDDRTSER